MLDAVLPSFLPLDIFWPLLPQEGLSGPEIFFEVFLADVDGGLVENFEHVVVKNWGFGVVVRVIPEKAMNQDKKKKSKSKKFRIPESLVIVLGRLTDIRSCIRHCRKSMKSRRLFA